MKACKKCGAVKELTEFHKNVSRQDGYCDICRDCRRLFDKTRPHREGANANRERTEAARKRKARWQIANRDAKKDAARKAVRNAINAGSLVPPDSCSSCGKTQVRIDGRRAIQAHHHLGYDDPLAVKWLCPKCHKQADAARATQKEREKEKQNV